MNELIKSLKVLVSDVVTFYFMAHGYHWNVEGPDFSQYHSLFASIYEDAYGSIDPIAENIRKLDDYAPFSLQKFLDLRTLDFKDVQPNPKAMAKSLLTANEDLLKSLKKAFDEAQKKDEQGIMNFLADRIDNHNKWSWQLRASTK
ncbi:Dps DNA-binding ferritin-like protein (oxidative damage protectant) [uncultured Caudovirales phage]|uniref:Dps DNA-binding ferritin-like protein (Oxidative damage protectant) n=1 Tax=uncultured Caudovirales phage TaxID=2100421 RepID=A0A6J5N429_9CAUD|nr:Dps DNA-binding ferritin-like protein (oxidative damage protectant) [uncultured Caudovirales phage]